MDKYNLKPNVISYNILIDSYNRCKMNEKSLEIFFFMKENKLECDEVTYINVIDGLSYRKDLNELKKVL